MLVAGSVLNPDLTYGLCFLGFVIAVDVGDDAVPPPARDGGQPARQARRGRSRGRARRGPPHPRVAAHRRRQVLPRHRRCCRSACSSLSAAVFLALPRVGIGFFLKGRGGLTLAGFSDGVKLGGHGVIKNDSTVVMRVEIDRRIRWPRRAGDPLARRRVRSLRARQLVAQRAGAATDDSVDTRTRRATALSYYDGPSMSQAADGGARRRSWRHARTSGSTRSTPTSCSRRACRAIVEFGRSIRAKRTPASSATTSSASSTAARSTTPCIRRSRRRPRDAARRAGRPAARATTSTSSSTTEITAAHARAGTRDHGRADDQLRQGQGDRGLARREPDVHARARGSRATRSRRLLPVRSQEGPLRVLRVGVRDPRARQRHPDAPGQRLPRRRVERVQGLRRGARGRRALVGRGLLPGRGLGHVRSRRRPAIATSSAAAAPAGARGSAASSTRCASSGRSGSSSTTSRRSSSCSGHRPRDQARSDRGEQKPRSR